MEPKVIIPVSEPESDRERIALQMALFERQRADAYEIALRRSASALHFGDMTGALAAINNALRP